MPIVDRSQGYPVDEAKAVAAEVSNGDTAPIKLTEAPKLQPSAKDRSIIRQTSWKIVGPAMANWTGSPEAWFEKCVEMRAKVEKDMLDA